jgi:cytidine deaminase
MALLREAQKAALSAYAPYSRFVVGAAVETADGKIYRGCNMENASYGLTICAEVGALQSALQHGRFDKVRRIAVVGGAADFDATAAGDPVTPCGRCRQLIFEASECSNLDVDVWCADLALTTFANEPISKLLPAVFAPKSLNRSRDWRTVRTVLKKRLTRPRRR